MGLLPLVSIGAPEPGHRVALLIGFSEYRQYDGRLESGFDSLAYCHNDIIQLKSFLQSQDWRCASLVSTKENRQQLPVGTDILRMVDSLADQVRPEDTFLLAYSGHGIRIGNEDYIVPPNAKLVASDDGHASTLVLSSLIKLSTLQQHLDRVKARRRVLVFNMCRSNLPAVIGAMGAPPGLQVSETEATSFVTRLKDLGHSSNRECSYTLLYSCRPRESSYVRQDKPFTVFGDALIQALNDEDGSGGERDIIPGAVFHSAVNHVLAWRALPENSTSVMSPGVQEEIQAEFRIVMGRGRGKLYKSHLDRAAALYALHRYDASATWFEAAYEISHSANVADQVSQCYVQMGDWKMAADWTRRALDDDPSYAFPAYALATRMRESAMYQESIPWYKLGLERRPNWSLAETGLGLALLGAGDLKESGRHLERGLLLDSTSGAATNGLARVRWAEKRQEEALGLFKEAVSKSPEQPYFWADYARIAYGMDHKAEAIDAGRRAIALGYPGGLPFRIPKA